MKYYVVDAFADEVFKGNPAGVCVLDDPIDDNTMQKIAAYLSRDLFVVLETEKQLKELTPNFSKMIKLKDGLGVIVTARGTDVDFVSRCFYPKLGVNEDPVTGSAHSNLIPFWSQRLNKDIMVARQLSSRGGTLYCKLAGDRVKISGKAVPYMIGNINICR
ncbi:MAG: PhzF family phenazine biosynthesis protein [Clostridium tyrobutyricum]|jgi:predicted PhzF superfamily epimerase YddE/YHI9|uniref:PhzF family phenazine biosynthesis protein n=2 Tax=Clostridium tyrobutyricum TaxID=1519 RepID=UPI0018A8A7F5|nr:PhzF family phenazine biosynthesis protein [Clostridium tyrobutyricum]MCH4200948.1 PhzF family phenazine biosynthesis protein [Clostridium tyrobutyricum]MCH4238093.1 PhzF family phenazine biosynthesis protein [Clostridium tyrobutyricum]MCH4258998.1 PhzF family phenazine biosynthesis protein [Clostridium tyrobutyricum]MCI1239850.1 PhzF family phenazine biosynthesis protein [Clostridium tyrobutyricum]MCI1653005.1 PhzF family phenazine biosynthesis protein [Clostridium tyrobutyricum]